MPGVFGGYDELGIAELPSEIGNVRLTIWLLADTPENMFLQKKELGRIKSFGLGVLTKQPVGNGETMYVLAKVNDISYNENVKNVPHRNIQATINFQVVNPFWRAIGTTGGLWDDGTIWDDGTLWDGENVAVACSGFETEFTVTPDGNAVTLPTIDILPGVGESVTWIKIQRLVAGAVVDELFYNAALVANDELRINAETKTITLNGVDAYSNSFNFSTVAWLKLLPGIDNAIRVVMGGVSDACDVAINYEEMYI
jgi:hypothetical protein